MCVCLCVCVCVCVCVVEGYCDRMRRWLQTVGMEMEKETKESECIPKVYNIFAKICPSLSTFDSFLMNWS